MKFLFWNIVGKDDSIIGSALNDLIDQENPDILLLAESNISNTFLATKKYTQIHKITKAAFGRNLNLQIYSKQNGFLLTPYEDNGVGEIMALHLDKNNKDYLLFGVHFMSKTNVKSPDDQYKRAMQYRSFINSIEEQFKILPNGQPRLLNGSILFGDINMNPFEKGLVDNEALFAIDLKKRPSRKLLGKRYFINPTYSIFGHFRTKASGKPAAPGTYYLNKDENRSDEFFWNCLDGMLFRPTLISNYESGESIEIITEIEDNSGKIIHQLFDFSKMKINEKIYSDHLPIKFKFNL